MYTQKLLSSNSNTLISLDMQFYRFKMRHRNQSLDSTEESDAQGSVSKSYLIHHWSVSKLHV